MIWEGEAPAEPKFSANREVGKSADRKKDWAHLEVRPPRSNLTLNKFGFGTFLGGGEDVGCLFDVRNDGDSELSTA